MKTSTFIAVIAALLLATKAAQAQSALPGGMITGNMHCNYGNSGAQVCVPLSPSMVRHLNCIRANPAGNGCATARTKTVKSNHR
jgi:hypothetical protein